MAGAVGCAFFDGFRDVDAFDYGPGQAGVGDELLAGADGVCGPDFAGGDLVEGVDNAGGAGLAGVSECDVVVWAEPAPGLFQISLSDFLFGACFRSFLRSRTLYMAGGVVGKQAGEDSAFS